MAIDKTNEWPGLGAIVRVWKGEMLATKSLTKFENLEPVVVEGLSALHAPKFCR